MKLFDGCVAAAALMAIATTATAQDSLNRPGSGARAAGMGNAFIAVADDGTAASWNPAGLSQLRAPELSVVHSVAWRDLFLEGYRTRDRSALFTTLKTPNTGADLEFASAAVPFTVAGRPVTVQVGWRRLYQISGRIRGRYEASSRVPGRPARKRHPLRQQLAGKRGPVVGGRSGPRHEPAVGRVEYGFLPRGMGEPPERQRGPWRPWIDRFHCDPRNQRDWRPHAESRDPSRIPVCEGRRSSITDRSVACSR